MKQLILIGLLACLGVAQITVTPQEICACQQLVYQDDCNNMPGCTWSTNVCVQQTCSKYSLQSDCLKASKYCTWNSTATSCGTFNGCAAIQITSQTQYKQCGQANVQCASYDGTSCQQLNQLTTQCSDYSDTYCTENIGSDGVCVWSNAQSTCGPITLCTQATQSQCALLNSKNGLACQWTGDPKTCTQITNCGAFTKDTCKYYFPSLTSPNMILCSWNGTTCVSATNSRYLTSTNCLTGTGYNYRWVSTASDPTTGICASCKSYTIPTVTVISKSQCQCSQFALQTDCNTTFCAWNTVTNSCGPIACTAVKSQSVCSQLQECYWDFVNKGGCTSFGQQTCADLPTAINSLACAAQSIYCAGFSGGVCSVPSTTCSGATTQQGCQNFAGTDGVCKWANGTCAPLKQCEQILDPVYCGSWQNQCLWNGTLQLCQPLTCASLTAAKCTYVLTGFQQSDYQLCRYNNSSKTCENVNNGLKLNAQNCASNTGSSYRWSSNNQNVGLCVACTQNYIQLQTTTSCTCGQFTNESDCQSSGYCAYSGTSCVPQTCSLITSQLTCASMSTCSWSSTGCVAFTQCSNLTATNQLECVAQNASCKGFAGGVCSNSATAACSTTATNTCSNSIGSDGVCYLSGTNCLAFSTCTGASQPLCDKNPFACYWNSKTQACQSQTCSNFTSQLNCKFFITSPVSNQVIPCLWNSTKNTCGIANEVLTQLTSATCVSNTHSTYRWVGDNSGYCVKCQQQITLRTQCPCSYLLTSSDCGQALECVWGSTGCAPLACSQINLQSVCATQATCAWYGGACVNFNTLTQGCGSLTGTTQMQCVSQQSSCLGTNGTNCTTTLNTCEASATANGCIDQFGSDGACQWNSILKKCEAVTSCSELEESHCLLKTHSCYYSDGKCQNLTCDVFTTANTCTFVASLTNQSKIQTCQFVGSECVNTNDSFELTESNCFANSARTSRWIPLSKVPNVTGICQSCSRTLIPYSSGKCLCYQFLTQSDCQRANMSCTWNGNYCVGVVCSAITTQWQCASTIGCGWTAVENAKGTCGPYAGCSTVSGKTTQSCLAYSISCRGSNGTTCTNEPATKCASYTTTTPNICSDNIGSDGLCIVKTSGTPSVSVCEAFSTCAQITNVNICNFYTNACVWDATPPTATPPTPNCQPVACGQLKTPSTCDYVITNILTGAIQLCQWNSTTKTCSTLNTFANQNQQNCASSSAFTYRWVPKSLKPATTATTEGYCASCMINYVFAPGQCACNQVFSQSECQQNPNCQWNGNKVCSNIACSSITSQLQCSTNPSCAWSAATQLCQPFTGCGDLAGVNAAECMSYSAYCGAINDKVLTNLKYACAASATSCQAPTATTTITKSECENTQVQDGLCLWQSTGTPAVETCVKIYQCSQITNQQICMNFTHTCYWGLVKDATTPSCQPTSCGQLNKNYCTYFYTNLGAPSRSNINYCTWTVGGTCVPATAVTTQQLTQENCYSSTLMMYRWTSSTANGTCASCSQYAATLTVKSFCNCSLLNAAECALAAPYCIANGSACTEFTNCSSIINLNQCGLIKACQVVVTQTSKTCAPFTNCTAITAQNALQCLEASINCPFYTTGSTTPCSAGSKCSTFTTSANCLGYNANVAAGYCYWNASSTKCETINNCGQITEVTLCGLQTNRCQWSGILNKCITQTCSQYTSQTTCSFIYTSYTPGDIALCQWSTTNNDCRSAPLSNVGNYTDPDCFVNTGHTYHYDGTTCVQCFQTFLSALFVILLMLV